MDAAFFQAGLHAALTSAKRSSAPEPDEITYSALFHLGHEARARLHEYFNASRSTVDVPSSRKASRIVTLLKPGRSPLDLSLHRPIALAS